MMTTNPDTLPGFCRLPLLLMLLLTGAIPTQLYATWMQPLSLYDRPYHVAVDSGPDMATDGKGNWIAVWYRHDAVEQDTEIYMRRSTDNGTIWEPARQLDLQTPGVLKAAPSIATDGQGNWVLAYHEDHWPNGQPIPPGYDMMAARSIDNGETWQTPTLISEPAHLNSAHDWHGTVEANANGTFVVVWNRWEYSAGYGYTSYRIGYARSTDGGQSWENARLVDPAPFSDFWWGTPALAADNLGNWGIVIHGEGENFGHPPGSEVILYRSGDNAASWQAGQLLCPGAATDGREAQYPKIITDGGANWIAAWYEPSAFDYEIAISRSSDSGVTWSPSQVVNYDAGVPNGQDSPVSIASNGKRHFVLTWEKRSAHDAEGNEIKQILSRETADGGVTWNPIETIYSQPATERTSYASVFCDGGHRTLCAAQVEDAVNMSESPSDNWNVLLFIRDMEPEPEPVLGPNLTGTWHDHKFRAFAKKRSRRKAAKGSDTYVIQGSFYVLNIGTEPASHSVVRFYLSDDAVHDSTDVEIAFKRVGNLQPGNRRNAVFRATVSQNPTGKFIIAVVDADQEVAESDETDNTLATRVPTP